MNHQRSPDEPYGNEPRRPPHTEQTYMNPNHTGQAMQPHPQTVPFGSIPQNSLPQSAGDPSMFAWGAPPYPMHHGMQQGHPQYQYPPHPGQHGQHPFMASPGHYAAPPPGIPHGQPPYGQQQPYPAHQGQMYPYAYHHPGQPMNHHMQPEHAHRDPGITGQSRTPSIASPTIQATDNKERQIDFNLKDVAHGSPQNLLEQNSPSIPSPQHKTSQLNLEADDDPVAKDELFQYAVKLLGPRPQKQLKPSKKTESNDQDGEPQDSQGHPFFATRAKSPDLLSYKITPISSHTIGAHHDQVYAGHTPSCNCRRPISRAVKSSPEKAQVCLKLYCECFAYGALCTDRCACSSACFNNARHSVERAQAVASIMQEDPNGFRRDMDWMTDLQRTCRNDHVLAKERKGVIPISRMEHEGITDDSLRIAKLPPNRYTMDLKGDNGVIYRALAFSLTHPKLHRRRKKAKVPLSGPIYKERIGYPELELVANLESKKVDYVLQKVLSRVEKAADGISETKEPTTFSHLTTVDKLLAECVVQELAQAQAAALSVKDFVSSEYFEGPKLKRKAVEALSFSLDNGESPTAMGATEDGFLCLESLPQPVVQDPQDHKKMKGLILSVSEDTAIIQHTASAIRSIARRLAHRRVR